MKPVLWEGPHLCRWVVSLSHIFIAPEDRMGAFGCKASFAEFFSFLDQKQRPEYECEYYDRWKKSSVRGSARQTKCHYTERFQRTKDACEQLHVLGGQPRVLLEGASRILGVGRGI